MKKLIKYLCVVSFLLLLAGVGFACGEPTLEKIELTIDSSYATYVGGNKGYIVEKEEGKTPLIPIVATLTPSSFSLDDLSWSTTYTDVAFVNDKGVATCRWTGSEDRTTTITATYNKNGQQKSASILLTITSHPLPKFENKNVEVVYSGKDIKDSYKVLNSEGYEENFVYRYENLDKGLEVDEIMSCGKYRIKYCYEKEGKSTEYARMEVKVLPYTLTLSALSSGTSKYGEDIDGNFYNSYNDETITNGINIDGGIGDDEGKVLGKMIYTTTATSSSKVGTYEVSVAYVLYNSNYTIKITKSTYSITKKKVVLQVDNQTITYGGNVTGRKFNLYDYDKYVENNYSLLGLKPLDESKVKYKNDIVNFVYKYKLGNEEVGQNQYGYIDCGVYNLGCMVNVGSNLEEIPTIVEGQLSVNKKSATVTPVSQKKIYGESDPDTINYSTSDVLNKNEIVPFLYINYNLSSGLDLGENNSKAPAGEYNYAIYGDKNSNYTFEIDKNSTSKFTVEKCSIEIEIANQEFSYTTPQKESLHTVSYYSGAETNYLTPISSIKVAGKTCEDFNKTNFDESGEIVLPMGDKFSFEIRLVRDIDSSYYVGYDAFLDETKIVFSSGNKDNYNISLKSFKVNLNKVVITITPTGEDNQKVYDAVTGVDDTISTYLSQYTLSNGEDISTILTSSEVLSLRDANGKYWRKTSETDSLNAVDKIRNVGQYKVFLSSNLSYISGKEYIDFELDTSKDYFFTITPKKITINPEDGQTKVYCDVEPELRYKEDSSTPLPSDEDSLVKTGALSRENGENVGTYNIISGDLSYGDNYTLSLGHQTTFQITPREINVKPFSYTTTYGDSEPNIAYQIYVVGTYDENLYSKNIPETTGSFELKYDGNTIQKVGGYYPVKLNSYNNPVAYTIAQGTFKITNGNYQVSFDNSATYLVKPRELNINLVASTYSDKDNAPKTGVSLRYSIDSTPLVSTTQTLVVKATEYVKGDSTYSVESIDKLDITLKEGDTDVKSCYNITLGQNVVYTIEKEIIEFRVVWQNDHTKNQIETIYDGKSKCDLFTLVVATEGYEFAHDSTGNKSNYSLVFSNSSTSTNEPTNVGSFNVGVVLGEGDQIVVKRKDSSTPIVFTSFNRIQDNCAAILSQKGFLTINKAKITYDKDLLAFENTLTYSSGIDSLPNIKTNVNGKSIFSGVNGASVSLMTYASGRNYEYKSSPTSIEMLSAGTTHNISVVVAVRGSDGNVDGNYEPLAIEVPLEVVPKEISFTASSISLTCNQGDNLVYDGSVKTFALSLGDSSGGADSSKYHIEYSYNKLQVVYENSVCARLQKFVYDGTKVTPVVDGSKAVYVSIADLGGMVQSEIETVTYNSKSYIVIGSGAGNRYCYLKEDSLSTQNAGIYICSAKVVADANYVLTLSGSADSSQYLGFMRPFEIQRLGGNEGEVEILNWQTDFQYGAVFNVAQQDTLPFVFAVSPDFKSDVVFSTADESAWKDKNYVLDVGAYKIGLKIDTTNCYFSREMDFNVICREAKVYFPEGDNSYEYSIDKEGNPTPQMSFLKSVYVVFKNSENIEDRIYYIENGKDFKFRYYSVGDEETELTSVPSEIGEYFVIGEYNANNYAGSTRYDYRITKTRYTEVISAVNRTAEYNPEYTATNIESLILSMLVCDMDAVKEVQVKDLINNKMLDFATNDWIKDFVVCGTPRRIKYIISFKNDTIADRDDVTAELTFIKINITSSILSPVDSDTSEYTYSGYPVYKELAFKDTPLAPNKTGGTSESILDKKYTIYYGKKSGTSYDTSYITVNDRLGNLIFVLQYVYYAQDEADSWQTMSGRFPISPNIISGETKKYKVHYSIESWGANYNVNASLTDYEFTISKSTEINVNVSYFETTYTGEDLSNLFDKSKISITNSIDEVVNYQLIKNDGSLSTGKYSETKGICFVYSITKDGVETAQIVDVGTYKIQVSLMYFTNFDPENYFGKLNFAGITYTVNEIKINGTDDKVKYKGVCVNVNFEVKKANFPYNIDSEENVAEFINGTNYRVVKEGNETRIEIASNGTFALNESASKLFTLRFFKSDGNVVAFDDLSVDGEEYVDYSFDLKCNGSNYQDSSSFVIRKYKDALPELTT